MPRSLPPRPSLDQLKRQAKDVLKAHDSGDVVGCSVLRSLAKLAHATDSELLAAHVALQDAQFALALDYGFKSWGALRRYLEKEELKVARTGGCFCGAVRYEITGPVLHQGVCHCLGCKRSSGAGALPWFTIKAADFKLTQGVLGEVRSDKYPKATCDGHGGVRTFCPKCGTPISWKGDHAADKLDVTMGSLDDVRDFAPTEETFTEQRLPWVKPVK